MDAEQHKISRREFLRLAAVAGVGIMFTGACTAEPSLTPVKSPATTLSKDLIPTKEIAPLATKKEARELLNKLSDSPYKDFVLQYAGPLLEDQIPSQISLGAPIKVWSSTVTEEKGYTNTGGTASISKIQKTPFQRLQQDANFTILLPYLSKTGETISESFNAIPAGTMIPEGIEPAIRVLSQDRVLQSQRQTFKDVREFALIKECFTIAYELAYIEAIIKAMQQANLPIYIDNNGQPIEAVIAVNSLVHNREGRLMALMDVGPLLLTAKVVGPSRIASSNQFHPYYKPLFDDLAGKDFGSKDELLPNTIKYINSNQALVERTKPGYVGNLNKPT